MARKLKRITAVSSSMRKTKSGKTVRVKAHIRGMGKARRPGMGKVHKYETHAGHFLQKAQYHSGKKEFMVSIGGKKYKYFGVPKHVAEGFSKSLTKGNYFATIIKKYRYKRMD